VRAGSQPPTMRSGEEPAVGAGPTVAGEPQGRSTGTAHGGRGPHAGWVGLGHVRRHPGDVLRVLVGGLVVAVGGLAARHGHVFAFDADLFRLVNQLPDALGGPLLVVMQLGALAAVPVVAAGPWLPRPARRATWWMVWLVALGRLYDGAHLPLDVVGGAGLDRPAAVGAVAVNTAAGALVHVLGLLVAAVLVGHTRLHTADIPRGWPELVALVGLLAAGGLLLWSPLGRRRLVAPAVRAGRELAAILRRPGKAAQLLGGSAGVTLTYALALAGCLAAFDAQVPLASIVAVYLAGAAVASVSPTPGGLGAMEAALVAGLTAVGASAGPAVAGVLAFRLLTFWLPVLPGWLAYRALRADGTI
jgi:hypothetical protein